ncbi:MAG: hypothetical protein ACOX3T_08485 [Bdellovibrionota bacterium]
MNKLKVNDSFKNYYNKLSQRERKLFVLMVVVFLAIGIKLLIPKVGEIVSVFSEQSERLKKANRDIEDSQRTVHKYLVLKMKQKEIEKKFEKNEIKEGHLSYVDSLKSQDMFDFAIGTQQEKEFGKDFNQVSFKINFKATSLATIMNFIKKLESEERKYLISELSIKKAYGNFTVVIEVNSIERKVNKV